MSKFLCKAILFGGFRVRTLAPTIDLFCVLRNPNVGPLRWLSISSKDRSFTVSYLIDSLGLSPKAAISASKIIAFETSEKPDKVVRLLEGYGFGRTQISTLARVRPSLLVADSEKTILPKLEFFKAKGVSWPKMAKGVSIYPSIFHCSLDKQIIPAYEFFRSVFGSDKKLILTVQRCPDILLHNVEKYFVPSIAVLRELGVPDSNIAALISTKPRGFIVSSDKFGKIVEQVVKMGFSASRITFVMAVAALMSMSKSTWESKVMAYKKWGWSDEDVSKAFEKYPQCMTLSLDKLTSVMDFFVNEMGLRPPHLVKYPMVLNLSLDKRLKPRHFLLRALLSKGLVKKEVNLGTMYVTSEEKFLQKFVTPYEEEAPELMKLYKDKLGLSSGSETDEV